jgi:cytidine deaminase
MKKKIDPIASEISSGVKRLHAAAVRARTHAYSPYSKFKVGAALRMSGGTVFTGCNVENASYGGTVCAERTAILKAVSEGQSKIKDLMVVTDSKNPAVPCALCLQTMAEFCQADTRVWIGNLKGIQEVARFSELLTRPFGPKQLKAAR